MEPHRLDPGLQDDASWADPNEQGNFLNEDFEPAIRRAEGTSFVRNHFRFPQALAAVNEGFSGTDL